MREAVAGAAALLRQAARRARDRGQRHGERGFLPAAPRSPAGSADPTGSGGPGDSGVLRAAHDLTALLLHHAGRLAHAAQAQAQTQGEPEEQAQAQGGASGQDRAHGDGSPRENARGPGQGPAPDVPVPPALALPRDACPDEPAQAVEAAGALLAAAVRTAPRSVRARHPYPFGAAGPEGFAALGVAETLLHAHDLAERLRLPYAPPPRLAEYVLTRVLPRVRPGADPWRTLLWATGRGTLPGRAPVTAWQWCTSLVLRSERLRLEGVTPAAAADLAHGGTGGFSWLPGGPGEGTRDAAGLVWGMYGLGRHDPKFGLFALVRREDDVAVGGMGFHGPPDAEGRAEIGYDRVEGARGHGYATEALRTLSRWAPARADVRTLFARVERANLPSQKVVSRAGHVLAGGDGTVLVYERVR